MKPMLASPLLEESIINALKTGFLYGSPKLDGIRALGIDGILKARSLKPIPNKFIQEELAKQGVDKLDGELIVGAPNAEDVYRSTFSGVMSIEGTPEFTFYVFDYLIEAPYKERLAKLASSGRVKVLEQIQLTSLKEIYDYETKSLEEGYEGIMLRRPDAPYKFGRATAKSMDLMKVKREEDAEAVVVDIYPAYENTNESYVNELGHTDRTTHAEGKVAKDMVGGFVLQKDGTTFKCSAGKFTHDERGQIWQNRTSYIGKLLKYRSFAYGVLNAPRFPRALGWRDEMDT